MTNNVINFEELNSFNIHDKTERKKKKLSDIHERIKQVAAVGIVTFIFGYVYGKSKNPMVKNHENIAEKSCLIM